jgi:hypothetical protein
MRRSLVLLGVAAAVVLLATSASADNRGVSFTGTGFISGPACVGGTNPGAACTTNANCTGGGRCQVPSSSVWEMNADGTLFLASPASSGTYMVEWTRENGWGDQIGAISGTTRMSPSGATIMGNGVYPGSNPAYAWPGVWTGVLNVWNPIPADPSYAPCGSSRISLYDQAGEGDYAVGLTWQGCSIAQGFLWNKSTNATIALGRPNGRSTRANAVTFDGTKVIGWGTIAQGLRRGASWQNGTWTYLGDPNSEDVKECVQTGGGCTQNSNSATSGCPEFVNDGYCSNRGTCQNKGTCVSNVCVGGSNPGTTCTSNTTCRGSCAGGTNPGTSCSSDTTCAGSCTSPINPGVNCTSDSTCQDTLVCAANPNWNDDLFKGEAYDVTDDGLYACGRNYNYGAKWTSGYRANPDGTFTELLPPETWPYLMDPFRISQNGKTIVGVAGTTLDGKVPMVWIDGVGTIDLQLFLIAQGLDELYFWYLVQASTVSADGTVIAGYGYNPDNWMEGWIVDMKKLWICHAPPGHPENARTLGIDITSAGDHVAHGDFLGTCEFLNSGALSRAVDQRKQNATKYASAIQTSTDNPAASASQIPAPRAARTTTRKSASRSR